MQVVLTSTQKSLSKQVVLKVKSNQSSNKAMFDALVVTDANFHKENFEIGPVWEVLVNFRFTLSTVVVRLPQN